MAQETSFYIGQIVDHLRFGYRGVIVGVDSEFGLSEEWYQQMARSQPPRDRPWYHVLVDNAEHTTYVAERNLAPSHDHSQINHPMLGDFFDRYDGDRYLPRETTH